MADKLAKEAADECCMGRHCDNDLSNDYTQSFKYKYSFPLLDVKGKQFLLITECLHILSSEEICENKR